VLLFVRKVSIPAIKACNVYRLFPKEDLGDGDTLTRCCGDDASDFQRALLLAQILQRVRKLMILGAGGLEFVHGVMRLERRSLQQLEQARRSCVNAVKVKGAEFFGVAVVVVNDLGNDEVESVTLAFPLDAQEGEVAFGGGAFHDAGIVGGVADGGADQSGDVCGCHRVEAGLDSCGEFGGCDHAQILQPIREPCKLFSIVF